MKMEFFIILHLNKKIIAFKLEYKNHKIMTN